MIEEGASLRAAARRLGAGDGTSLVASLAGGERTRAGLADLSSLAPAGAGALPWELDPAEEARILRARANWRCRRQLASGRRVWIRCRRVEPQA
jgi:hypothetical protein